MPVFRVQGLFIYPVKSLRGISVSKATIDKTGFRFDRRFMVVESGSKSFVTQRELARMAEVTTAIDADGATLILSRAPQTPLRLPLTLSDGDRHQVTVWEDTCTAISAGHGASRWISEALGGDFEIVYMPDSTERRVDTRYALESETVAFNDAFPYLLTTTGSLDDLNTRLSQPIPMARFRPNIVVEGPTAFAEDTWSSVQIGDAVFHVVKPCSRCVIITQDQQTGERDNEPLAALSKYRLQGNKVMFGQNLLAENPIQLTTLTLGDVVHVRTFKDAP